jgi:hypothetical protein
MNICSPAGKLIDSALKNAVRKASPAQWRGSGVSRSMPRRRTVRSVLTVAVDAAPSTAFGAHAAALA